MKFINIKIGEVSPIFCIYGDEGRGLHSQRDGAKAVSEAESISLLSSNGIRASARRRAASSVKRRSRAAPKRQNRIQAASRMASMGAFLASFRTGKTVAANAMTKPKRRILTGIQIVKLSTAMRMKKRSARILLTA